LIFFSTPIYIAEVNEAEIINSALKNINLHDFVIETKNENSANRDWVCDVLTGHNEDFLTLDTPWVKLFLSTIIPYVEKYIQEINLEKCKYLANIPWVNIYRKHDYQEPHDHINGDNIFSYAYMHRLPPDSGNFVFLNRNSAINYIGQQDNQNNFVPKVKEGSLVLFPSSLQHMVTPNNVEEERITIAGNISKFGDGDDSKNM